MGLRNSVNVGLWWIILPKFFVRTSTILYGRECVFAKIFPFFSLLLSKVVSDFIQNFIKKRRKVLLKTQFKRERERQREERTLFHAIIIVHSYVLSFHRRRSDHHSKTFVSILTRKESISNKREKI